MLGARKNEAHDVCLSHAGLNGGEKQGIAAQIRDRLRKLGVTVFFDADSLRPGRHAGSDMVLAAATSTVFLALLSTEYIRRKWTMKELDIAMATKDPATFHDRVMELLDEEELSTLETIGKPKPVIVIPLFFGMTPGEVESADMGDLNSLKRLSKITGIQYYEASRETHLDYADLVAAKIASIYFPPKKQRWFTATVVAVVAVAIASAIIAVVVVLATGGTEPPSTLLPSQSPSVHMINSLQSCNGGCEAGFFCFDDACCEDCKRITLGSVHTDRDGVTWTGSADNTVEPTFFINGARLFDGELSLPSDQLYTFASNMLPNSVGGIQPDQPVTFKVVETDDITFDDVSVKVFAPGEWHRLGQSEYETVLSHDDPAGVNHRWTLYYTVATECCV